MIDNRTQHFDIPLPDPNNLMRSQDVPRLIQAIHLLDAALYSRATKEDVQAAIAQIVGNAPESLDTLSELADALRDDANFAATMTNALALKANLSALAQVAVTGRFQDLQGLPSSYAPPMASSTVLGGIKIGAGLVLGGDGTVSTAGSGGGTGLPAWQDIIIKPTADNQAVFTPDGGYPPGQIDIIKNGSTLVGNGDDYTASNGTTITLTTPANKVDTLVMRKWFYLPAANAINKTGDTMTGYLGVPANASGSQAPRVSEVVRKAGDTMTGPLAVPANAAGAQVPQVQEVVKKAGDTMTGPLAVPAGASGSQVPRVAEVVRKIGDTMIGPLVVPAGATGTQAPQVQEVVKKTGDTMTGALAVPAGATGAQTPRVSEVIRKVGDAMAGKLELQGSSAALALVLTNAAEKVTISAAAATGTINLDLTTQAALYYSGFATANWTINVRGNGTTTLNSLLDIGQSTTVTFWAKQGTTAYRPTVFQVDGAAVTPVWQGTVAPTAGTPSGLDIYTLTITKTADATFLVMASQSPFK